MTDTTEKYPYTFDGIEKVPDGGMIHRAILAVTAEIPPVDKNGELELGSRKIPFTKVDEIRDAMNPILTKHGIVSYLHIIDKHHYLQVANEPMTMAQADPETKLITNAGREIRDGKIPTTRSWATVEVSLTFVFVGDNSEYSTSAAGLAYDTNSDKALSKAITQAVKRILTETFKITDRKELDDDSTSANGDDPGNRAATTDRREGGDRGQQARTAAQAAQATGTTRRSGPAKQAPVQPAQPSEEAVAAADEATGEVPDETPAQPEPQAPPQPSKLDVEKARVRTAVKALQARDGAEAWTPVEVDKIATEVTGKATRPEWITLQTAVKKVADALEKRLADA